MTTERAKAEAKPTEPKAKGKRKGKGKDKTEPEPVIAKDGKLTLKTNEPRREAEVPPLQTQSVA